MSNLPFCTEARPPGSCANVAAPVVFLAAASVCKRLDSFVSRERSDIRSRPHYPSSATLLRTVAAARASGIDVAGIELSRDGSIRILEARSLPEGPSTEFDIWNKAGLL